METDGARREESADGGETEEMDPLASSMLLPLSREEVFSDDSLRAVDEEDNSRRIKKRGKSKFIIPSAAAGPNSPFCNSQF